MFVPSCLNCGNCGLLQPSCEPRITLGSCVLTENSSSPCKKRFCQQKDSETNILQPDCASVLWEFSNVKNMQLYQQFNFISKYHISFLAIISLYPLPSLTSSLCFLLGIWWVYYVTSDGLISIICISCMSILKGKRKMILFLFFSLLQLYFCIIIILKSKFRLLKRCMLIFLYLQIYVICLFN